MSNDTSISKKTKIINYSSYEESLWETEVESVIEAINKKLDDSAFKDSLKSNQTPIILLDEYDEPTSRPVSIAVKRFTDAGWKMEVQETTMNGKVAIFVTV